MKRILALIFAFFATGGQAQVEGTGPQFAHVTSIELADAEVKKGNLVKVHLFPLELGGADVPPNVTYIPIGMEDMWRKVIGTIEKFATEGLLDGLKVEPEYNGASCVASSTSGQKAKAKMRDFARLLRRSRRSEDHGKARIADAIHGGAEGGDFARG